MENHNTSPNEHQQYSQDCRKPKNRQNDKAPARPAPDDWSAPAEDGPPPDPVDSESEADDSWADIRKMCRPAPLAPFARFVLETFLECDCHDRVTLQQALLGPPGTCTFLVPRGDTKKARDLARRTERAYRLVAQEVLAQLRHAGYLRKDSSGWIYPTIRGTEGLPPRRRAELYLSQLAFAGVKVFLKDGRPVFNAGKKRDPYLSEGEIRGGLAIFREDIADILRERARVAPLAGEKGGVR